MAEWVISFAGSWVRANDCQSYACQAVYLCGFGLHCKLCPDSGVPDKVPGSCLRCIKLADITRRMLTHLMAKLCTHGSCGPQGSC